MSARLPAVAASLAAILYLGVGCERGWFARGASAEDSSVAYGRQAITKYGCDTCHVIPGVRTATGHVGPPLTALSRRTYLAGRLQNTPANLERWIRAPHSVDPLTAMPETGVTEQDGRDLVAFLYTLE